MRISTLGCLLFWISHTAAGASDQVVLITDSHGMGEFGSTLSNWLRHRPSTSFRFFASGGSAPLQWLNGRFTSRCAFDEVSWYPASSQRPRRCETKLTPNIDALWNSMPTLSTLGRKITLVALGTNLSEEPKWKASQISDSDGLIQKALRYSDLCIWIGPPNMRRHPGFDAKAIEAKIQMLLDANQGRCAFIDSRNFSHYPTSAKDGIHYDWPGSTDEQAKQEARKWAEKIILEIEKIL